MFAQILAPTNLTPASLKLSSPPPQGVDHQATTIKVPRRPSPSDSVSTETISAWVVMSSAPETETSALRAALRGANVDRDLLDLGSGSCGLGSGSLDSGNGLGNWDVALGARGSSGIEAVGKKDAQHGTKRGIHKLVPARNTYHFLCVQLRLRRREYGSW
ncbi:hypothetical protein HBI17_189420 [Parastagonospora nodorum]|nr:hypothetical protein HBI17_189420 [Parastagonospora nodorum]